MRIARIVKVWAFALMAVGFTGVATAAAPGESALSVRDVALADGGVLRGQVMSADGIPMADVAVHLMGQGREIAVGQTNAAGQFSFANVPGGIYHLAVADCVVACRAWAPGTAPPAALNGVLMIAGADVVRGGMPRGGALRFYLSNPYVIAGLVGVGVGGGIAIAAIVDDDDDPVSP